MGAQREATIKLCFSSEIPPCKRAERRSPKREPRFRSSRLSRWSRGRRAFVTLAEDDGPGAGLVALQVDPDAAEAGGAVAGGEAEHVLVPDVLLDDLEGLLEVIGAADRE